MGKCSFPTTVVTDVGGDVNECFGGGCIGFHGGSLHRYINPSGEVD